MKTRATLEETLELARELYAPTTNSRTAKIQQVVVINIISGLISVTKNIEKAQAKIKQFKKTNER